MEKPSYATGFYGENFIRSPFFIQNTARVPKYRLLKNLIYLQNQDRSALLDIGNVRLTKTEHTITENRMAL